MIHKLLAVGAVAASVAAIVPAQAGDGRHHAWSHHAWAHHAWAHPHWSHHAARGHHGHVAAGAHRAKHDASL